MPDLKSVLLLHLDYTAWATSLLLDAAAALTDEELARDLKASHKSLLDTLRHTFHADRVWLARFQGERRAFKDDAEPSLAELRQIWPELLVRFREFADELSEGELESDLSYLNIKGEPYSAARWKVLLHVVNHGTLHRGQVMGMLRQLGHAPPATDLIYFYLKAK